MELDFADTSALSDPNIFQAKEKAGKNANGKERKEAKKKGKKERAEEREKERDKIEKSWDVPALVPPTPQPVVANGKGKTPVKSSPLHPANGPKVSVDQDTVRASIISTLSSKNISMSGMPRNDFVREVLTLIHVSFGVQADVLFAN